MTGLISKALLLCSFACLFSEQNEMLYKHLLNISYNILSLAFFSYLNLKT